MHGTSLNERPAKSDPLAWPVQHCRQVTAACHDGTSSGRKVELMRFTAPNSLVWSEKEIKLARELQAQNERLQKLALYLVKRIERLKSNTRRRVTLH
jgi:hypothetical protein